MIYNSDAEITALARRFIDHSLPKEAWTHGAHFATAIWLMASQDYDVAHDMPDMIRTFNVAKGGVNTDDEGYHETITQASIRAAHVQFEAAGADKSFFEIVDDILSGPFGRSDWLFDYWTKLVLFSPEARRVWFEPDIKALPF